MKTFDAWSFMRDALSRGAAIEQDSEAKGRGYDAHSARLDAAARDLGDRLKPHLTGGTPIDMVLPCPRCGRLHIDAPEPATGWTNPPHKSHLCRPEDGGCGLIWRPADVPTNGVAAVKTKGEKDTPTGVDEPVTPERLLAAGLVLDDTDQPYDPDEPYPADATYVLLTPGTDDVVMALVRDGKFWSAALGDTGGDDWWPFDVNDMATVRHLIGALRSFITGRQES